MLWWQTSHFKNLTVDTKGTSINQVVLCKGRAPSYRPNSSTFIWFVIWLLVISFFESLPNTAIIWVHYSHVCL